MSAPPRRLLKIIIIGPSAVGKTSLMKAYVDKKFSNQYKATIGADFCSAELEVDGQAVSLQIWDTAGQERFQSLGLSFYRGADCCVLVYDVTNPKTLDGLLKWKNEFLSQANPPNANEFPFVVLGNKCDLTQNKKVPTVKAQQWCEQNGGMVLFETSAKDSFNIEEAFQEIARSALKENQKMNAMLNFDDRIRLNNDSNSSNRGGSDQFLDPRCASC
eukprot:GDKJ01013423.1.p1 GENE.GDKJ01013423.1~~GDKJ01013423.1.p1  ORF type:complete len:217 (+),score=51.09 GDKJ01013423.1:34-684(+)